MLRVEKLNFNYGPRQVLKSLSFTVEKGKLVGFLGPNGAGKTTTMNLITGYYYSGDGDIFIDQISMKDRPLEAKKKLGFLSENAPLYPDMIVEDYLSFVCQLKGVFGPNLKHWVNEAIENTRLQEVRGRLISRLSKGYRQRVGLAQAMVAKPDLIVLMSRQWGWIHNRSMSLKSGCAHSREKQRFFGRRIFWRMSKIFVMRLL